MSNYERFRFERTKIAQTFNPHIRNNKKNESTVFQLVHLRIAPILRIVTVNESHKSHPFNLIPIDFSIPFAFNLNSATGATTRIKTDISTLQW